MTRMTRVTWVARVMQVTRVTQAMQVTQVVGRACGGGVGAQGVAAETTYTTGFIGSVMFTMMS